MLIVKDVMVRDVITISPCSTLREALSAMSTHQIKSLLVVQGNELIGLLAMNDILARLIADLA